MSCHDIVYQGITFRVGFLMWNGYHFGQFEKYYFDSIMYLFVSGWCNRERFKNNPSNSVPSISSSTFLLVLQVFAPECHIRCTFVRKYRIINCLSSIETCSFFYYQHVYCFLYDVKLINTFHLMIVLLLLMYLFIMTYLSHTLYVMKRLSKLINIIIISDNWECFWRCN